MCWLVYQRKNENLRLLLLKHLTVIYTRLSFLSIFLFICFYLLFSQELINHPIIDRSAKMSVHNSFYNQCHHFCNRKHHSHHCIVPPIHPCEINERPSIPQSAPMSNSTASVIQRLVKNPLTIKPKYYCRNIYDNEYRA